MSRRRTKDYVKVFKALIKEARKYNLILKPKITMTDFELAAFTAFKEVWPDVLCKGCLFHLGQSLLKKLGNLGLKTLYSDNEEFRNWIKRIFALALIPIENIDEQWKIILETQQQYDRERRIL